MTEISLERQINLQNTQAFIEADPISIVLQARVTEPDGAGGVRTLPPAARPLQTFRLLPQTDSMSAVQGPDGITYNPTYVLLGTPDQQVGQWDRFSFGGVDFIVTSPVRPDVRLRADAYEIKVDVARL